MKDKELYYQSLATTKAVDERLMMEHEKNLAKHFKTIQKLLGCTSCRFAHQKSLDKGKPCCQNDAHSGNDTEHFKGDDAPLCSIREEGKPSLVEDPEMPDFLKALMLAGRGRTH